MKLLFTMDRQTPLNPKPDVFRFADEVPYLILVSSPFIGTVIDWRLLDSKRVSWEPAEVAATAPAGTMRALSIPAGHRFFKGMRMSFDMRPERPSFPRPCDTSSFTKIQKCLENGAR